VTVQACLGHAMIATTNIYLHHLGSSADRAGLDRLNALGAGVRERPRAWNDNDRWLPPLPSFRRWEGFRDGAAYRNRTDDLLITRQHVRLRTPPQQPSHLRKRT